MANPYMSDPFTYGYVDPSLMYGYPGAPVPGATGDPIPSPTPAPAPAPTGGGTGAPQITNPQDPAQINAWLQWQAQQPGTDPILDTPGGIDYYRTQILANGGLTDTNYWGKKSTLAAYGGAVGAGGAGGGGVYGGGTVGGAGSALGAFTPNIPTSDWSPDPRTNDLFSMLSGMSKTSLDVKPTDPLIANQVDAFGAAETRQQRNYLDDLAERGGGTDNLNMERRMSSEKIGQDTAQFQGQLMWQELSARRQEIEYALTAESQFLTEQERMDLQNKLSVMDNLLAQAGLQQGAYQFDVNNQYRNSPMNF